MDRRIRWIAGAVSSLLLTAVVGNAAEPPGGLFGPPGLQEKHAKVTAQFAVAKNGQPARLFVTATIQPKWYTYSITQKPGGPQRTIITVGASKDFRLLGPLVAHPEPAKKVEPLFDNLVIESHTGTVTWYAPIELAAGVDPAKLKITGKVAMQVCDPESCVGEDYAWTASLGTGVDVSPPAKKTASPAAVPPRGKP